MNVQTTSADNSFRMEKREYELTISVSFTSFQDRPTVYARWELINKSNVDESQHTITA